MRRRAETNKLGRGLIAGAIGLVLLTGAGGTFANWFEEATVNAGTLNSGHLEWTLNTATATWKDVNNGNATINAGTFKMVPGDKLAYTVPVDFDLVGNNLKAEFDADISTVTGTMASHVTKSVMINGVAGPVSITPATSDGTVAVVIEMPFTTGGVGGDAGEGTTLDLSTLKLTLTQTAS